MALTKIWAGTTQTDASTTTGDYSAADNWEPVSLVNSTYRWTASGSGTNEYYLELAAGGDPSLVEPANVQEVIAGVRTNMTAGTAGSLAASTWDWADNDTLGFSTIYVVLAGGTDPDASDTKHVTLTDTPKAGDDVVIPAESSTSITSGMKQSGIAIGDFIVADGFTGDIGDDEDYLEIDPNRFEYHGSGTGYIDIFTANISVLVTDTGTPATGLYGLNLIGSNMTTVAIEGGSVAIAPRAGDTATVVDVQAKGTALLLAEDVTLTNLYTHLGTTEIRCNATKVEQFDGTLVTSGTSAITTFNHYGGTCFHGSTGTITTATINGDTANFETTINGLDRTITTLNYQKGRAVLDNEYVTVTTFNKPTVAGPYELVATSGI